MPFLSFALLISVGARMCIIQEPWPTQPDGKAVPPPMPHSVCKKGAESKKPRQKRGILCLNEALILGCFVFQDRSLAGA